MQLCTILHKYISDYISRLQIIINSTTSTLQQTFQQTLDFLRLMEV